MREAIDSECHNDEPKRLHNQIAVKSHAAAAAAALTSVLMTPVHIYIITHINSEEIALIALHRFGYLHRSRLD